MTSKQSKGQRKAFRVGEIVYHRDMGEYVRIVKDYGPNVIVFYTRCGEKHVEPHKSLRSLTRREAGQPRKGK
jgi:hypothetical protein